MPYSAKYQATEVDRFEDNTNLHILDDKIGSMKQLEDEWEAYNTMPKDHRRMSDAKSMELFGKNNTERYEELRSRFLKADFDMEDIPLEEEAIDNNAVDFDHIKYDRHAVDQADKWEKENLRFIMRPMPTEDKLEELWSSWNSMIKKHRRESDWKSTELFGIDNKTHYEYLKSKFLKKDIPPDKINPDVMKSVEDNIDEPASLSPVEEACRKLKHPDCIMDRTYAAEKLLELANMPKKSNYDEMVIQTTLDDTIEYYKDKLADILDRDKWPADLPFFDPEEMKNMGVFDRDPNKYMIEPDNVDIKDGVTVRDWFDNYELLCKGVQLHPTWEGAWVHKLEELYLDYDAIKESGDIDRINARKQSILELGWNPEFDFTPENRVQARERLLNVLEAKYGKYTFIDLENTIVESDESINEALSSPSSEKDDKLYPIYIVLVEGKSQFSKAIKAVRHSVFTHAAISFDTVMNKLYSFNMHKKEGYGLSFESVKGYPPDSTLGVFGIFVKKDDMKNINKNLDYYIANKDRTSYSMINVLTIPFQIPLELNMKMICSQFVDRILKLSNIDITGKASSTVFPGDFADMATQNNKIYQLYHGRVDQYNSKKVDKVINSLKGKEKYIREFAESIHTIPEYVQSICENVNYISRLKVLDEKSDLLEGNTKAIYEAMIKPMITLSEAREFPIQFEDDGTLLIRKMRDINFQEEYDKSHKLLPTYEKNSNIEAMKYELSRLWFLNQLIEKQKKKTKDKDQLKELNNIRARVLNDFHKYLDIVQKYDKKFNMEEYYKNSPFSDAAYSFRPSTLKHVGAITKSILLK